MPAYAASVAARNADRAAQLHLRLPRLGAGRLAGPGRLPRRDQDDLPSDHPRGRQDHGARLLRRLRRARSRSNFGGRRIKDYLRQEYRNQDDELVATFICSRMRFERSEMQKRRRVPRRSSCRIRGRMRRSPPSRSRCWPRRRAERTPRYWDDVNVGDEIDIITKGPIGLTDEIAYIAAGAAPIPRHRRASVSRCGAIASIRAGPFATR